MRNWITTEQGESWKSALLAESELDLQEFITASSTSNSTSDSSLSSKVSIWIKSHKMSVCSVVEVVSQMVSYEVCNLKTCNHTICINMLLLWSWIIHCIALHCEMLCFFLLPFLLQRNINMLWRSHCLTLTIQCFSYT